MRIFWIKVADVIKTLGALLIGACLLFYCVCAYASAFPFLKGERTYYLYSSSSQAEICKDYSFSSAFSCRGESVLLESECAKSTLEDIIERFDAKVLFIEEVDGVTSYYCHSKKLGNGVGIKGEKVNLHIAIREKIVVVGTPIIFGGY